MKRTLYPIMLLAAALLATGCSSISYKPSVSLGASSKTINSNVKIEPFVDQSPAGDKGTEAFGVSACEPTTLQGELAADVTDAVLTDFENNMVFSNIKRRFDAQPDLVLSGTIHRFYGTSHPDAAMWLTIPIDTIWIFGVPILHNEGAVDLEITLSRPDGTIVGTYHGKADFSRFYSMYHQATLSVPTQLNNAFSQSVEQIREQIMKDSEKLAPERTTQK